MIKTTPLTEKKLEEFPHLLTAEQLQEWIQNTIIPEFVTPQHRPSKHPKYVLLTGQPGAGKTYASKLYQEGHLGKLAVAFGADDIRLFHPLAAQILKTDRANYSRKTKKDAGVARNALLDYCFENAYDIMIDSILLNPNDYNMPTLAQAKAYGFKVECVALAVPNFLSEVSLYLRQEEQFKNGKVGFPVTLAEHVKSYKLLPDILAKMVTESTVDRLEIRTRTGDVVYDSAVDPLSAEVVKKRLHEGRRGHLTPGQLRGILQSWNQVIQDMTARQATEDEINKARSLRRRFIYYCGVLEEGTKRCVAFQAQRGEKIPEDDMAKFNKKGWLLGRGPEIA